MRDTSTHYEPRPLWRNVLTYTGAVTVLVALMFIVSFLFLDLIVPAPNPYIGLFTFLIFPACMVFLLFTRETPLLFHAFTYCGSNARTRS